MPQTAPPEPVFQSFEETSDKANVAPRIKALREELGATGLDAFLVPRADAHRGEQVPPGEARLAWLTGFTGSAGTAVIGTQDAALFVDGRYTLQAPAQTDTDLVSCHETPPASLAEWIKGTLPHGASIGYDPWLHTPGDLKKLAEKLGDHATLVGTSNLVDAIWTDRPGPPESPIFFLDEDRAGKSAGAKLTDLRATLGEENADALVLTLPESLCWLFNMRGHDIPNTPSVLAFGIVPHYGEPELFLAPGRLTEENKALFKDLTALKPVADFPEALRDLGEDGKRVWIDPATCPAAVADLLHKAGATLIEKSDPILLPKARKTAGEVAGMRAAHQTDGIAMARFLAWVDREAPAGDLDEIGIVSQLEAFRRRNNELVDISFDTICGTGPHGAIVHYRVTEGTNRALTPGELLLVDSGGQYLSGTTDITRTMATGQVSDEQKDRFTRVLKGMIAISMLRFPKGTSGAQIDVLARQFLWQVGLNYAHGTGHGVGAFLGVHEGPMGISPRYATPLEPGMILSNEPGFYREGAYGIRVENLLLVREADVGDGGYLDFETLTLAPIDLRLIDADLLTTDERDWLNAYHARVYREIGPKLDSEDEAWLRSATRPL